MKRYTSPEIVIVELETSDIAVQVQTSNIYVNPTPAEDDEFAPARRNYQGAAWSDYEQ